MQDKFSGVTATAVLYRRRTGEPQPPPTLGAALKNPDVRCWANATVQFLAAIPGAAGMLSELSVMAGTAAQKALVGAAAAAGGGSTRLGVGKHQWLPGDLPAGAMALIAEAQSGDYLKSLKGQEWLDDAVINDFLKLVTARPACPGGNPPRVWALSSFLYPTFIDPTKGYSKVKTWSRQVEGGIFTLDALLVPLHLGIHWACGVVDFKQRRLELYDSKEPEEHGSDNFFPFIKDYLSLESKAQRRKVIDFEVWTEHTPRGIPQQVGGVDCGVFACQFANYRALGKEFDFTQADIVYLRERMTYELATGGLLRY